MNYTVFNVIIEQYKCFRVMNPVVKGAFLMKKKAIDQVDLKIISIMQNNARITNHELAGIVNLSPSSCLQRVRRLEEGKYISGYKGSIDLDKICRTVTIILTVSLHDHSQENFETFNKAISKYSEIVEGYTVSGNFDYFLRVVCPDMNHYLALNDELINCMAGTANISSHVVLEYTKPFQGYDIEALVD